MSTLVTFVTEGPVAGLAAAVLNLVVALGLIAVSLALGAVVTLLVGLPSLATDPQRAIRARDNRRVAV